MVFLSPRIFNGLAPGLLPKVKSLIYIIEQMRLVFCTMSLKSILTSRRDFDDPNGYLKIQGQAAEKDLVYVF